MSPRLLVALILFPAALSLFGSDKGQKEPPRLQSFYILREAISDATPFWFNYVLEISPGDGGTTVNYIRIAPLGELCTEPVTVKAEAAHLLGKAPQDLAGAANPCRLTVSEFQKASDDSKPRHQRAIFDTARWNIVAGCGNAERIFRFPYPEEVDLEQLKMRAPRVFALWNLEAKIVEEVFGEKSVFYNITQARDLELQRIGQKFLPDLRSGRFDKGFHAYCSHSKMGSETSESKPCSDRPMETLLRNYRESVWFVEPSPNLVNAGELHLLSFELPDCPRLAQLARIEGEVVISVTLDQETGKVKDAESLKGHPLLAKGALAIVRHWRFDPKTQNSSQPIRVILSYAITCP